MNRSWLYLGLGVGVVALLAIMMGDSAPAPGTVTELTASSPNWGTSALTFPMVIFFYGAGETAADARAALDTIAPEHEDTMFFAIDMDAYEEIAGDLSGYMAKLPAQAEATVMYLTGKDSTWGSLNIEQQISAAAVEELISGFINQMEEDPPTTSFMRTEPWPDDTLGLVNMVAPR